MPHLSTFNPQLARVGIKKNIHLYSEVQTSMYKDICGNVFNDNQLYTLMNQVGDFGMAPSIDENQGVVFDDFQSPFQKQYFPINRGLGYQLSEQADYTDIYGEISKPVPKMMLAMNKTKEQVAANLINNAFSSTLVYAGPDGVALASTSHPLQTGTSSNSTTTGLTLGILNMETALQSLMGQVSHRGDPEPAMGPFRIYLGTSLSMLAERLVGSRSSDEQPQTADREHNIAKRHIAHVHTNPYFTSSTQWSLRSMNDLEHGLFLLNRIPLRTRDGYDIDKLVYKYVIFEEYVAGNNNWRGFWATQGA